MWGCKKLYFHCIIAISYVVFKINAYNFKASPARIDQCCSSGVSQDVDGISKDVDGWLKEFRNTTAKGRQRTQYNRN